jgi:hypothetical protein
VKISITKVINILVIDGNCARAIIFATSCVFLTVAQTSHISSMFVDIHPIGLI